MCPAYVEGLIGPGDRKRVQPMATRDGAVSYDQLHHFIADAVWDIAPLEAALLAKADRLVGGDEAFLVIDDNCTDTIGHSIDSMLSKVTLGVQLEIRDDGWRGKTPDEINRPFDCRGPGKNPCNL